MWIAIRSGTSSGKTGVVNSGTNDLVFLRTASRMWGAQENSVRIGDWDKEGYTVSIDGWPNCLGRWRFN